MDFYVWGSFFNIGSRGVARNFFERGRGGDAQKFVID
jgi:hypothetical protein